MVDAMDKPGPLNINFSHLSWIDDPFLLIVFPQALC